MTNLQIKAAALPGDFLFHDSWLEAIDSLPVETVGRLMKAVSDYVRRGLRPDDADLAVAAAFLFPELDADRSRIEAVAKRPRSLSRGRKAVSQTAADAEPVAEPQTEEVHENIKAPDCGAESVDVIVEETVPCVCSEAEVVVCEELRETAELSSDASAPHRPPKAARQRTQKSWLNTYGSRARAGDRRIHLAAKPRGLANIRSRLKR